MNRRWAIAVTLLALAAGSLLVACSQASSTSVSSEASSNASESASEEVSDASVMEANDRDDPEKREREERINEEYARLAAYREERKQEYERWLHDQEWREKFPTDDYTNTLLIGDSLMQNAESTLYAVLPGVTVDADSGRTLEHGGLVFEDSSSDDGVLDHVRRDQGRYDRYVIGTGNNEMNGMSVEAAQEIVDCLGPDKEIYFITMISVKNMDGSENTNASIDAMVEQYDNVHKIDWYGLVSGNESEYLSDGIHVQADHLTDYATCIKDALDVVY